MSSVSQVICTYNKRGGRVGHRILGRIPAIRLSFERQCNLVTFLKQLQAEYDFTCEVERPSVTNRHNFVLIIRGKRYCGLAFKSDILRKWSAFTEALKTQLKEQHAEHDRQQTTTSVVQSGCN